MRHFVLLFFQCVDADGKCFNTEECCGGLTCAAVDSDRKNLRDSFVLINLLID